MSLTKDQLEVFRIMGDSVLDKSLTWTEANQALDRIDFEPSYRFYSVEIDPDGVPHTVRWVDGKWERVVQA